MGQPVNSVMFTQQGWMSEQCLSRAGDPEGFWKLIVFGLCWNPEEAGFNTCCSNEIIKLVSQSEGKQAKNKRLFLLWNFMWAALESVAQI